jgi:hypothetical protein
MIIQHANITFRKIYLNICDMVTYCRASLDRINMKVKYWFHNDFQVGGVHQVSSGLPSHVQYAYVKECRLSCLH